MRDDPMGYVKKTLGSQEDILYVAKFHWTYTFVALLALVVLGWILIGIGIAAYMMIRKWTTEIVVTSERFVYKTGWIARKTQEVNLEKIEEVNLTQSVLGRLLGYGNLRIQGTGVGAIDLPQIDAPLRLRKHITDAKEAKTRNLA